LIFNRQAHGLTPCVPEGYCFKQEAISDSREGIRKRFVCAKDHVQRLLAHEKKLFLKNVLYRHVHRQAPRGIWPAIANVVRTTRLKSILRVVLERWPHSNRDPGIPFQTSNFAKDLKRSENSVKQIEAGREVTDLNGITIARMQCRDQNGAQLQVALFGVFKILKENVEKPRLVRVVVQKTIEERISVELAQAAPDEATMTVDERTKCSIPYGSKVDSRHRCHMPSNETG
jgi:hypothetical protein